MTKIPYRNVVQVISDLSISFSEHYTIVSDTGVTLIVVCCQQAYMRHNDECSVEVDYRSARKIVWEAAKSAIEY